MPQTITDQQLNRALLLARHKLRIRWATLSILFLIAALSLLFAANGMFSYFSQLDSYNKSMSQLWQSDTDWASVHQQEAPQPLTVGTSYVWPRGNNRYDLAAEVSNPNTNWGLQGLTYQFIRNDAVLAEGSTVMAPGQKRLLTYLGLTASTTLDTIDSVRLTKVQWRHVAGDATSWWLYPSEPQFQSRTVSGDGTGAGTTVVPRVTWEAVNNTGNNLRQVTWQIILRTAGRVDQVTEYTARNVLYGTPQRYDVGLASDIGRPDQIEVVPISDVFDPTNWYQPDVIAPATPDRRAPTTR